MDTAQLDSTEAAGLGADSRIVSVETGGAGQESQRRGTWLLIGQKDRGAAQPSERRMGAQPTPDSEETALF